jgi:glutamate-1-semialdehyde 2,1-aminomutase
VVTEVLRGALAEGTTFGMPTPGEVRLAEAICARVPGCEQVRLVSSGTEAAMSAVRLARGATGRSRVVKFEGCYHGHADVLLAGAGSGVAILGLPDSAGVPPAAVADTLVVPYNVVPELDSSVACVIVEPVAANMNLVAPAAGFLEGLRQACDRVGALLIFDEVISGFRLGPGGATARFGVNPDLWCFGKVIGGGLPVGAFGGRADLMAALAPLGPVYQAGTLSGNPLATAAGAAVLSHLAPADYDDLANRVAVFAGSVADALTQGGLPASAALVGTLAGLHLDLPGTNPPAPPTNYQEVRALVDRGLYPRLFHALLRRGVMLAPGAYEILFIGLSHEERLLSRVVDLAGAAAADVVADLQRARDA